MTDLRFANYAEVRAHLEGNRRVVWTELAQMGSATSTEIADRMGWSVLSVRPRLTELHQMGYAEATGARRNREHVFLARSDASVRAAFEARENAAGQMGLALT